VLSLGQFDICVIVAVSLRIVRQTEVGSAIVMTAREVDIGEGIGERSRAGTADVVAVGGLVEGECEGDVVVVASHWKGHGASGYVCLDRSL